MNEDSALLDEIKNQLQDDILHLGWLCQILGVKNPQYTDADRVNTVVDAIIQLHQDGAIIVGCARETNGIVLIDPWPGQGHELRTRVESAIDSADEQDRDFCVWIQLAEHAVREQ